MHPVTFEIHDLDDPNLSAAERKKLVPIPENEVEAVRGMNRKQRRKWLALNRKTKD